jgi:hypothetical protein
MIFPCALHMFTHLFLLYMLLEEHMLHVNRMFLLYDAFMGPISVSVR